MEVVIFLILTWFFAAYFLFQKKSLSLLENFFLFFFFFFINKNVLTMLSLNLKMIEYSREPHLFISFWFQRTIIGPILLLIFVNKIMDKPFLTKIGWGLIISAVWLLLDALGIEFNIITYTDWSFGRSLLLSTIYLTTAFVIASAYRYLIQREKVVKGSP
ncbi:hypothetical protein LC085_10670 [Bacillus tianshenii]|uniref:hypothetical protein n=1 Tax=Sutcliffiella tianshenii TaxID=1463404 RepID=UPI001CD5D17A|nr:hypothetical protein [Bacillus tianshenii]MCA1320372.1 hypothetical protein [Bacillus tianshenii]